VAVIGGGDVALEDALFLARGCEKVYLIHRRDALRGARSLQQKVFDTPNIEVIWDSVVDSIDGEGMVQMLQIRNKKTNEKTALSLQGVFIAVGITPDTGLVQGLVDCDEAGYVRADETCVTNVPGVFAAGDLRTKKLRQIVTAVADGANAITSAENYIYEF
ncbi:MAG: NAD(P)/FAD-dependent oxidoreductase, partial [Lachnospiraceae bacterium]|nr:NAD(P)/FAD-dependent oxidoreductase [Lachnospiraceae bacterium]